MDADAAVIWSVLWNGRMYGNKQIYEYYRSQNKPVFIIEVGSLIRGKTWKVSLNNITLDGIYPTDIIDVHRPTKLKLSLQEWNNNRKQSILIATQHDKSLQWEGMPSVNTWINDTISQLRQYTDRPIVIRPHPRCTINVPNIVVEYPVKIPNTYDIFNIDYTHHCIVNYSSGVGIQASIAGAPVICSSKGLAYPVASSYENIENIIQPDRTEWFLKICHTEWTVDEIERGIPQSILLNHLT